jgi:hypothetical protein
MLISLPSMPTPGIQGGTIPIRISGKADVEPYGHLNDKYQADDWFADYYCATLSYLFGRFKGSRRETSRLSRTARR